MTLSTGRPAFLIHSEAHWRTALCCAAASDCCAFERRAVPTVVTAHRLFRVAALSKGFFLPLWAACCAVVHNCHPTCRLWQGRASSRWRRRRRRHPQLRRTLLALLKSQGECLNHSILNPSAAL
jgi:hypothetical protein